MDYVVTEGNLRLLIEGQSNEMRDRLVDELIKARKEKGLTQQDIADTVQMPRANISRIERKVNVPSLESLMRYAAATGKQLKFELVDLEPSKGQDTAEVQ